MTNVSGSLVCPIFSLFLPKTLKMGQTSDPETLVIHQKLTPGNNPQKFFKQHYDHGGSLQLHKINAFSGVIFNGSRINEAYHTLKNLPVRHDYMKGAGVVLSVGVELLRNRC
jgi:hypothetical protein